MVFWFMHIDPSSDPMILRSSSILCSSLVVVTLHSILPHFLCHSDVILFRSFMVFPLFDFLTRLQSQGFFASQHGGRIFQALVLRSAGSGNPTERTHSATLLAALCWTSEAQFWQKRELGCLKVEIHEDSRCLGLRGSETWSCNGK